MQDTARRKAASLALMTIMLAGGMTIAMPGEQPQAAAQTGTLSVSATEAFGGPQILEIVVDDPSRDGLDPGTPLPDVRIDDDRVVMAQSNTGKWYAYVASDELTEDVGAQLDLSYYIPAGEAAPIGYSRSGAESFFADAGRFLSAKELGGSNNGGQIGVSDFDWPVIQVYEFKDDSPVDITHNAETVTLRYEADLSDLASIRVDRADVPAGGQVHVAISDVQLNLNPTEDDIWYMWANGTTTYGDADPEAIDWQDIFRGDTGRLAINNLDPITIEYDADEGAMVEFEETGPSTGVFVIYDTNEESRITVNGDARAGSTFTVDYAGNDAQVIVDDFDFTLELVRDGIGSTWDSGEDLTVRLSAEGLNLNTLKDDDMTIADDDLPVLILGEPITLATVASAEVTGDTALGGAWSVNYDTHVATLTVTDADTTVAITLTGEQLERLKDNGAQSHYVHYSSTFAATTDAQLAGSDGTIAIANGMTAIDVADGADGRFNVTFTAPESVFTLSAMEQNMDLRSAVANAEEDIAIDGATADTVKNAALSGPGLDDAVYVSIDTIDTAVFDTPESVLEEVRRIIGDNLVTAEATIVADIFTFGADANHAIYRALLEETGPGSAVFEGTIEYKMLNQINADDPETHADIAAVGDELVIILDGDYTGTGAPTVTYGGDHVREDAPTHTGEVSFDAGAYTVADEVTVTLVDPDLNVESDGIDIYRVDAASEDAADTLLHIEMADGCTPGDLAAFSLRESADGSFVGTFDVPRVCGGATTTGKSLSVTYYDFRDRYGGMTEWRDSATVRADTGSVSLDRTVYPVPADDASVVVHVSVRDADFDESSSNVESIRLANDTPPVVVRIGEQAVAALGTVDNPLSETFGDSGVFEASVEIGGGNAIGQGSVITVSYTDPTGASGSENTVTDSAVFDLRSATLQSDRSSYVIGQDALLTLIEPDLNLDSADRETVPLALIGWDSEAGKADLGDAAFGAVPQSLRETGPDTGVFQVVITIPKAINGNALERGEPITLTYVDEGPSGADTVGDDERDVELFIATSDLGAAIELDRDAYTWTDKVFITIVAPDYNFDSYVIDEIGGKDDGEVTVRTRGSEIDGYRLAETGPDTGVFAGEVTLTGFTYGKIHTSIETGGSGPTDGTLRTSNEDGLSVSFEYSDSEAPLVASATIRWNVGEVQWLEADYAATGSGVVRVTDPDMNLNPDAVDNLDMVAYSETFLGGIDLTVTETQESSGVFEGVVEFDSYAAHLPGHRLQVSEGDTVTARYDDETLPKPDGRGDSLAVTATALFGSAVPPLERAPASNLAVVDASGSMMPSVSAGQQIQITADLTSGQDTDQYTTYLVLVEDGDGVPVHISWISGSLGAGKTFSPSQSWTPDAAGSYVVTVFVWESVTNPTALSPQLSITIDVA